MKTGLDAWLVAMADSMVCEITEQMAGIRLRSVPEDSVEHRKMNVVYGLIGGDFTLEVQFFAEKLLFYRLAQRMMREEPNEQDVEDYAIEFFNTLVGRFISEIIHETKISARLLPIKYEMPTEGESADAEQPMHTLYFVSDEQEQAAFCWTAIPIDEMMRSGTNE